MKKSISSHHLKVFLLKKNINKNERKSRGFIRGFFCKNQEQSGKRQKMNKIKNSRHLVSEEITSPILQERQSIELILFISFFFFWQNF